MAKEAEQAVSGIDLDAAGGGEPLAQRLAREVERLIREGQLEPGQKLPPTVRLAEMLEISRQVAQDGLALLAQRNLLRRKPGLGTMVLEPRERPTIGLLAFVGGSVSLTADVGWVIANDFLHLMHRRGWSHREYVTPRRSRPPERMPPNLVRDLLDRQLDALVYGTIYESFVREKVPSNEVPTLYVNPDQKLALPAVDEAAQWLWRQDCRSVGILLGGSEHAGAVGERFRESCDEFGVDAPAEWFRSDCSSSIGAGRALFDELYGGQEVPDGLLVMDDMVAYGLIEEARERDYYLDHSRIVVLVNKGSNLYLPPTCPRIEVDWQVAIRCAVGNWAEQTSWRWEASAGREELYRFVPRAPRQAPVSSQDDGQQTTLNC